MDSDEDNDSSTASPEKAPSQNASITGFLFGNINKEGQLETNDVFDEDCKRQLGGLTVLGMGSMVSEIIDNDDSKVDSAPEDGTDGTGDDVDRKLDEAVDYSDITEAAEDLAALATVTPTANINGDDDYDDDEQDEKKVDSNLMPPPSWIPGAQSASPTADTTTSSSVISTSSSTQLSPSKRLDTPLAAMLPPEYADKDVREWFPEFRTGEVLRFSRIFRPVHKSTIWRKRKRKRPEEDPAMDEHSHASHKPMLTMQNLSKETSQGEVIKMEPEENDESGLVTVDDSESDLNVSNVSQEDELLPEECMPDDYDLIMRPLQTEDKSSTSAVTESTDSKVTVAEWRYGPAQLWYDMLEVDHAGQHFDYGFKLKTDEDEVKPELDPDVPEPPKFAKVDIPDEAYHMVTQVQWEDDVIFKGDDVKSKVLASQKTHGIRAGWIPSVSCRTVQQFMSTVTGQTSTNQIPSQFNNTSSMLNQEADDDSESWFSIFPIENEALLYGKWENDVIWDAQAMTHIPKPPMMTLDPNDENIILGIPDDRDPEEQKHSTQIQTKKEKDAKKSKILLGKAGLIKDDDEDEEEEEEQVIRVDPFNISNDEYYNAKLATDNALRTSLGSVIQHSNPAVELRQPFFPTHMGPIRLRNFHRPPLKRYSYGTMSTSGPHPVHPLLKQIKRKAKLRESERLASGGGDMFFMRTPEDLTGRDADLILAEYSEEYPPIMMRAGMATKIKNYYKRKPGKDNLPPNFTYGELAYAHMSPFLGNLSPGQCVQAFQNNMFRAPIYKHAMPHTDFLIIRNRQSYHIREVNDIFTVGQMCPLYEVPGPNSKRSNNFIRDFLQVYIYRLFLKSKDDPRRIKMEEIKKAFPSHSESSIRKRLKLCATFKRTGTDSNWWVLKSDFRLPTEEELRAMVSPEQCCGYYSLLSAEQRLKDAGYGEKSLFAPEQDDEEDAQVKMEDEVKVAPWNTSRAYIHAMKGRCLLALTGVADPTGTGEGFSYVKIPNKPNQPRGEEDQPTKKTVTGTDADLRRLPLKDAKNLLRKFGVPEQEIKKLSRWEVIDVVRTMSTEQAKAGQEGAGMGKFARGNRFSLAEHQERYKEECQRIFDLQNRILSSTEVLSTDEESSSGEDSDFEEMGKNIENILSNQKTSTQLSLEREEAERKELQRMMLHNDKDKSNKDNNEDSINEQEKKLIITRTFIDAKGVQYKRTEIVRKQPVIDIYLRIKQTKDPSVIRQFSCLDSNQKEEMKKEKRRIQEQLRRIKRNEQKGGSPYIPPPPPIQVATFRTTPDKKNKRKKVTPFNPKLKCGACGAIGHMRTNKECPLFSSKGGEGAPVEPTPPPKPSKKPIQVAMTLEQEKLEGETDPTMADKDLINVDGTKVKISKSLIQHADNVRRKSLVLKFPKNQLESAKKKRKSTSVIHCDYLKRPVKGSNRRRTDPVVSMSTIFEDILNEMRDLPDAQPFLVPVNERLVPDYYKIIKKPIDLQTLRNNIRNRRYQSRESFLMEVSLLVKNCELYNGPKSVLTQTSRKMLELVLERLAEKEDRMMRLEKAINPLLDDDDLVSFSYLLEAVVEKMKAIEGSWPFHTPVNKKKFQDYYEIIKSPMDVNTVQKNVTTRKYHTIESFLYDAELIYENSKQYNGPDSNLTAIAKKVRDTAVENVQNNEQLIGLEDAIKAAEEAALEAAETDSLMTGELESIDSMSVTHKDDPESKLQNLSREDEFVDIEGDFDFMEGKVEDSTYNVSGVEPLADNSLAQDLQMSPDNSDDDSAKLSSTGSDSECGDTPSGFDNFDYNAMADNVMGNTNPGAELMDQSGLVADENAQDQAYMDDTEAGENFDPTAFFQSFAPNQDYQNAEDSNMDISQPEMNGNQNANIDNDLQISESDDSSIGNRLSSDDSEDDSNPMF